MSHLAKFLALLKEMGTPYDVLDNNADTHVIIKCCDEDSASDGLCAFIFRPDGSFCDIDIP